MHRRKKRYKGQLAKFGLQIKKQKVRKRKFMSISPSHVLSTNATPMVSLKNSIWVMPTSFEDRMNDLAQTDIDSSILNVSH